MMSKYLGNTILQIEEMIGTCSTKSTNINDLQTNKFSNCTFALHINLINRFWKHWIHERMAYLNVFILIIRRLGFPACYDASERIFWKGVYPIGLRTRSVLGSPSCRFKRVFIRFWIYFFISKRDPWPRTQHVIFLLYILTYPLCRQTSDFLSTPM